MVTPLLLVELIGAGLAGRYPFLDPRTSQFFLVLVTVVAALGYGGLIALLARSRWTVVLGVALLLICGASFVPASARATHNSIPDEDVRGQIQLVLSGRRFGDVVLVTSGAANAFGYYWPTPRDSLTGRPSARSPSRSTTRSSLISWSPPAATAPAISRRCRACRWALGGYGSWWVTSAWRPGRGWPGASGTWWHPPPIRAARSRRRLACEHGSPAGNAHCSCSYARAAFQTAEPDLAPELRQRSGRNVRP